jgi:hypothetical protein
MKGRSVLWSRKKFNLIAWSVQVYTDILYTQIQHATCFIYHQGFIKDKGTYEEVHNVI